MKKLLSVLLTALLLGTSFSLFGCGLIDAFSDKVPTTYKNAEEYTAGNTEFEGKVDNFSIWWLDGTVTLRTHKEDTVRIEENANKELDDKFKLHWNYRTDVGEYGNVLNIHYSASGNFDYGDLKKDITVYLPENDGMDLTFTIQTAAVDVDVSTFENTLKEIAVINYSGKVSVRIDSADEVRISGQSDDDVPEAAREFFFRADGHVDDLGISSSYAKVDVAAESVRNADVGTVFADLIFAVEEAKSLALSNSGGQIDATVLKFDSIDVETFDKPCRLTLSPEASFVLSIKEKDRFNHKMSPDSVTVDFENMTQNGTQYTVGTGEKKIEVATNSTLTITPLKEEG